MKHTKYIRAAAVAAAMTAGLAAGPANAAEGNAAATRITSQEQLRAAVLQAVTTESVVCSASSSFSIHPMGGYPPPPIGPS